MYKAVTISPLHMGAVVSHLTLLQTWLWSKLGGDKAPLLLDIALLLWVDACAQKNDVWICSKSVP